MTDAEIMKALRCCADRYCKGCSEQGKAHCRESISALAWDLIYRQKAEISKLKGQVTRLEQYDEERDIRLHARLSATAKAEGIKEFAERLKETPIKIGIPFLGLQTKSEIEEYFNGILLQFRDAIDAIVKEMTEDKT